MDFFAEPIPQNVSLKKIKDIVDNPILYEEKNYNIVFLFEKWFSPYIIQNFVQYIKKASCSIENFRPKIIFPFQTKNKEIKGSVVKHFSNCIDLKKLLNPNDKVVTIGRTLYSVIKSEDLTISGFYDYIFNKTYFYDMDTKCYIFPADNIIEWFFLSNKNCWQSFFLNFQIKNALSLQDTFYVGHRIQKITVANPNAWLIANTDKTVFTAIDIETNNLDPWNLESRILEVSISFDGVTGYLLPGDLIDTKLFGEFIKNKKLIMHNGKFDAKFFILKWGIPREYLQLYHDTWPGSHTINEMQKSKLKSDAYLYTTLGGYDRLLDNYIEKFPECKKDFSKIPKKIRHPYAIMDAIVTFQIFKKQLEIFKTIDKKYPMDNGWSITRYFYEVRMPGFNAFLDVELNGMYVNWELLEKYSEEMKEKIIQLEKEILKHFNLKIGDISINSTNELGFLLEVSGWTNHGRAKVMPTKKVLEKLSSKINTKLNGKKGVFLTGDEQLKKWLKEDKEEIIKKILKFRELNTLYKTFIGDKNLNTGFFKYRKSDNKIHPSFGPNLTASHRHWCREPNLQNIPIHGDLAKWYRKIFIPPSKDFDIIEMDACGFQLRIGAIYSNDNAMRKVFTELGGDMHSMTAQSVLMRNLTINEFIKKVKEGDEEAGNIRYKAKGINFGLLFGMVAFTFAQNTIEPEWTKKEVYDYVKKNNLQKIQKRRLSLLNKESGPNERKEEIDEDILYNIFDKVEDKNYFSYCWAVASDIRDKFFKTYPGLKDWATKTIKFAKENGYVRSPFGAIRRLPQLLFYEYLPNNILKNLKNIALNSPVQNFEAVFMTWLVVNQLKYIKENNLKSLVFNNIHDANVIYVHKSETIKIIEFSKKSFEYNHPENKGIPQELEFNIADYYNKNQVWGFGDKK